MTRILKFLMLFLKSLQIAVCVCAPWHEKAATESKKSAKKKELDTLFLFNELVTTLNWPFPLRLAKKEQK